MKLLISLVFSLVAFAQVGYRYNPFSNQLDLVGLGYTAPSGYASSLQASASTLTVTLSAHGQGTAPDAWCVDSATGEFVLAQILNPGLLGDITFNFSPVFSGYCYIRGPGSGAGAAGNLVGPTSAVSGNLASYSGITGKILQDAGIATTTVVKGAANLTTVGAVPIVTSAGTLTQDQTTNGQFFWDATLHRLGVGNADPMTELEVVSVATADPRGIASSQYTTDALGGRFQFMKARGTRAAPTTIVTADVLGRLTAAGYDSANFIQSARIEMGSSGTIAATRVPSYMAFWTSTDAAPSVITEAARITNKQNLLLGGSTEGNFKLDVAKSGSSGTGRVYDATPTTGSTLLAVRAGAGQGSAQEFQVQANDGTAKLGMHYNGVTTYVQNANSSYLTIGSDRIYSEYPPAGTNGGTHYLGSIGAVKWDSSTGLGGADLGLARNAAGVLEVNSGVAGTYRDLIARRLQTGAVAVSALQACNAGNKGSEQAVSDALGPAWGATVSAGGAAYAKVTCNGTNWTVYGI